VSFWWGFEGRGKEKVGGEINGESRGEMGKYHFESFTHEFQMDLSLFL
jgi:hypothetical protein